MPDVHRDCTGGMEMAVVIKVRKGGTWVPVESLAAEQQAAIKERAEGVLRRTIQRQIDIRSGKKAG
jgi:hypothetical protein